MVTNVVFHAYDGRTNRVLGEFATLEEAIDAIGEQDDFYVMRVDEQDIPELVWET